MLHAVSVDMQNKIEQRYPCTQAVMWCYVMWIKLYSVLHAVSMDMQNKIEQRYPYTRAMMLCDVMQELVGVTSS